MHVAAKVTGNRAITFGLVVTAVAAVALLVAALAMARPSSPAGVGWFCAVVLFAPSVLSLARWLMVGPAWDLDLTLGAAAVPFALWVMTEGLPRQLDQGEGELAPDVEVPDMAAPDMGTPDMGTPELRTGS